MKVAISTVDGKNITQDHFGEGEKFLIYEVEGEKASLVEERVNSSPEEEEHGSREKANAISSILKDIPILVGYQFGPNIIRIKNNFLPVISREKKIEDAIGLLLRHWNAVEEEAKELRGNVLILSKKGLRKVKININNAKDF